MTLRKLTAILVGSGLALGLLGSGIGATFTDQATAGMTIQVGTFNIDISSTQGVVAGDAVTYTAPDILSSAAGSAPFAFKVTSTGSIPARIHVTATSPAAPFADMLGTVADFTLTQGQSHVFDAGLQWTELSNGDLGKTWSITYTVVAAG